MSVHIYVYIKCLTEKHILIKWELASWKLYE